MSLISIQIRGVAAELVLGNYMPNDTTIFNNWEEFYHYNDLIHVSQLLTEHVNEITVQVDNKTVYTGTLPAQQLVSEKSFAPVMLHRALYLRAECAEQALFTCEFEVESFDINNLFFKTQDYDALFKVGNSFISEIRYRDRSFKPEWKEAKPLGNICLLCRFENGYLVPLYDAIKKVEAQIK